MSKKNIQPANSSAPQFDSHFHEAFRELVLWRRDVRRFRNEPVNVDLVKSLIELSTHAPSVGNCQPWRFVFVESNHRRALVKASFERANQQALEGYEGDQKKAYAKLKLDGLDRAPIHIAVFADEGTKDGYGLGRQTMPETISYSVVGAIHTLWLAARMHGLGMGWVSILEPEIVTKALKVSHTWSLVAYLCLGWPEENHLDPELERHGWQDRRPFKDVILKR